MRLMLKFFIPVEKGNQAYEDGTMTQAILDLVDQIQLEAAYFMVEDGMRCGVVFFEETDQAKLPIINEALFRKLGAMITVTPALNLEDLKKGLAG